ncbi:hypothetical protein MNBD_ALPHA09-1187 [hydrothermal vent metagenome]|uniref:YHS domain-containing protein n=1 Tax=hydrothermal vent metagenome TaxID=652676 RepID=A0A3B0SZY1_9ZZZZ
MMSALGPLKRLLAAGLVLALAGAPIFGIAPAIADEITTFAPGGIAIRGTDPVAYFTMGKPVAGSDAYTTTYDGVTWKFSSAATRDAFVADPKKYAPAYGGYCATGTSFGYKVSTDPSQWKIVDGKLYLNNGPGAQRSFLSDIGGTIARADTNWPKLKDAAAN